MPIYDPTSASTADNYITIEYVDTSADDYVEYEIVGEWVSTAEYEISQDIIGLVSGDSFYKEMMRKEKLEKWKRKMITMDKKQIKTHMTRKRQYDFIF